MQEIVLPENAIADLCRRYQVRELAVFGSFVRGNLRPDSDIDLLVEFEPDAEVGFLALARMSRELSEILHRQVDLVPKGGLKPRIKKEILDSRRILYAA
ncbi:nucleotidyltransferase family protein [Geoalkalibacter halelectricus]|uniref:nucleotidyltransferase family protein n=1 Tax=Geoalkalibacter halelectricus TaxID=2847045 RepID=UPI003D240DFD